jgi:hypothetical protein
MTTCKRCTAPIPGDRAIPNLPLRSNIHNYCSAKCRALHAKGLLVAHGGEAKEILNLPLRSGGPGFAIPKMIYGVPFEQFEVSLMAMPVVNLGPGKSERLWTVTLMLPDKRGTTLEKLVTRSGGFGRKGKSGRKPAAESSESKKKPREELLTAYRILRLTPGQNALYETLGGQTWVRLMLDHSIHAKAQARIASKGKTQ